MNTEPASPDQQLKAEQPYPVVAVGTDLQTAQPQDFREGERVLYVPMHANGDKKHPDCERGVVSSANDHFVFVRYEGRSGSQATSADDLVKLGASQ